MIQKFERDVAGSETHRQHGDLMRPLSFFKVREAEKYIALHKVMLPNR
jgi:hypothetical protein